MANVGSCCPNHVLLPVAVFIYYIVVGIIRIHIYYEVENEISWKMIHDKLNGPK